MALCFKFQTRRRSLLSLLRLVVLCRLLLRLRRFFFRLGLGSRVSALSRGLLGFWLLGRLGRRRLLDGDLLLLGPLLNEFAVVELGNLVNVIGDFEAELDFGPTERVFGVFRTARTDLVLSNLVRKASQQELLGFRRVMDKKVHITELVVKCDRVNDGEAAAFLEEFLSLGIALPTERVGD